MKKIKFIALAIFMLPVLLFSNQISSNHNFLYSVTKPSKGKFKKFVKNNYVYNKRLKEAYENPDGNSANSFLYAIAMDYIYKDGSEAIKERYLIGAYSLDKFYGKATLPEYIDFLIRTQRYREAYTIKTKECGRNKPRCDYYVAAALHLAGKSITAEQCKLAFQFRLMHKVTSLFCKEQ